MARRLAVLSLSLLLAATFSLAGPGCMFFRSLDDLTAGMRGDVGRDAEGEGGDGGDDARDAADLDGGATSDGAAPPFCANLSSQPRFCDDFDDGRDLSVDWEFSSGPPPIVALDRTFANSPPASAKSTLALGTNDCVERAISKRFDGAYRRVRVGFAFAYGVDGRSADGPVARVQLGSANGDDACQFVIYAGSGSVKVLEHVIDAGAVGPETGHGNAAGLVPGKWVRLELDANYVTGRVSLRVDGAPSFDDPVLSCSHAPGSALAVLGFVCADEHQGPSSTFYDDATIDVE